jgi:hypothetical protein
MVSFDFLNILSTTGNRPSGIPCGLLSLGLLLRPAR